MCELCAFLCDLCQFSMRISEYLERNLDLIVVHAKWIDQLEHGLAKVQLGFLQDLEKILELLFFEAAFLDQQFEIVFTSLDQTGLAVVLEDQREETLSDDPFAEVNFTDVAGIPRLSTPVSRCLRLSWSTSTGL